MNLDIRYPLGMIFLAIGAILTVYGAMTHGSAMYALSQGIDINLVWGLLMLLFGAVMYFMAWRASANPPPPVEADPGKPKRPSMH